MAKLSLHRVTVPWFEMSTHQGVFRFLYSACDSAQESLWTSSPRHCAEVKAAFAKMRRIWNSTAVMRLNTGILTRPFDRLPKLKQIIIRPHLTRIGRSSWDVSFEIADAAAGCKAEPLALVQTVMVATNADYSKAVPLPDNEILRSLVVPPNKLFGLLPSHQEFEGPPAGSKPVQTSWITRFTDCDRSVDIQKLLL